MVVDYTVNRAAETCMIRLIIGPSPRRIVLPDGYTLTHGRGVALTAGDDAVLFAYGPVMLHEALLASEILAKKRFGLKIVNMPWLNRVDGEWLTATVKPYRTVCVLEDHAPTGGLSDFLLKSLVSRSLLDGKRYRTFAVEGYPACGTPPEALHYHRLDGASLAQRVTEEPSER